MFYSYVLQPITEERTTRSLPQSSFLLNVYEIQTFTKLLLFEREATVSFKGQLPFRLSFLLVYLKNIIYGAQTQ